MIDLIFLGTSQAVPTAKRNHTAVLLRYGSENILIDCGEGTQRQFRIAGINPCKLTRILITHFHGDHILGLPGLLQTLALNNYNRILRIYIPKGTRKYLSLILRMFAFRGKVKIKISEIEKEGIFLKEKDFSLEAYKLLHGAPCLAYAFKENDKRRINKKKIRKLKLPGKLIGELQKGQNIKFKGKLIKAQDISYIQKGKKISFIFDTRVCDGCYKTAKDADILIAESTYSSEIKDLAYKYKHLTTEQIANIAKKSKVKELIITHISQRYEKNPESILREVKKIFPKTKLAYDFMKIKL